LFSPLLKLSNNNLQKLSQAIAQLGQTYFRSFLRIYSIEPKPEPPWIIWRFY